MLKVWYATRWQRFQDGNRVARYAEILGSYNAAPNPEHFLFLTRSCYGGVVRFRARDGQMSTPVGVHPPIAPGAFAKRVDIWRRGCGAVRMIAWVLQTAWRGPSRAI